VARILKAQTPELRNHLLQSFTPEFRAIVKRFL
jgi:hypothetical protein